MNNIQGMAQIYKAMKSGNPAQVFKQAAMSTPALQPFMQMMNSGMSVSDIVDSELKKAGMTREQAASQLKEAGLI